MQTPVKERIEKLRGEIAQISERERPVLAEREEQTRRSGGSGTSASEIAGNPRRIDGIDRLEKGVNK
jgi:hypothetical protein